jgi:type II secretory pathway component PulJ
MSPVFKKNNGVTLMEVLLSVLLLSVVLLPIFSLFNASVIFQENVKDKVMIGYELQYVFQHVSKNVMTGIGDKNNPAVVVEPGNLAFSVRHIDKESAEDSPTYGNYADDTEVSYKINADGTLVLDYNGDGVYEESLIPKVKVLLTDAVTGEQLSGFYLSGNVLTVKLTAESFTDRPIGEKERVTLFSSCYPRLASFR